MRVKPLCARQLRNDRRGVHVRVSIRLLGPQLRALDRHVLVESMQERRQMCSERTRLVLLRMRPIEQRSSLRESYQPMQARPVSIQRYLHR